jgi:thiamine pyrophosphate-dependent acetolactate synthase large subunit-like protein
MLRGKIFHVDLDSAELDMAQIRLNTSGVAATVREVIDGLKGVAGYTFMTEANTYSPWLRALQAEFLAEQATLRDSLFTPSTDGCASIVSHAAIANLFMGVRCTDHLVIDGGGTALYSAFQAAPLDKFNNVVSLNAISSMGTAPGQMSGVLNSTTDGRVIGVIGDGSFAMALNALPKIALNPRAVLVVLSNQGYLAIRHTQERFLGSRFDGTWYSDGEDLPSVERIALALGMNYVRYSTDWAGIEEALASRNNAQEAASVIEIQTDPVQPPFWSVSTKLSLDGKLIPNPLSVMTFMGRPDD